jgi:IclR family pca regulon transcriptional regulator
MAALAGVREDGYSWMDGEFDLSVCGLSVPVRDAQGDAVAAYAHLELPH